MATRVFNNIKYLQLVNENNYKNKSLEDNVYFTLRDIFANVSGIDWFMEANGFASELTCGVSYEDRTSDFAYSNALKDNDFIYRLSNWLNCLQKSDFDFDYNTEDDEWYYDTKNLFKFEDWWSQLEELKILLNKRFAENKIK